MQILRSLLNSGVFMVLLVVAVSVYLAYSEKISSEEEKREATQTDSSSVSSPTLTVTEQKVEEQKAETVVAVPEAVAPSALEVPAVAVVETTPSIETPKQAEMSSESAVPAPISEAMPVMPGFMPMPEFPAMQAMPEAMPMPEFPAMQAMPEAMPMPEFPAMQAMPEAMPMPEFPVMPAMPEAMPMPDSVALAPEVASADMVALEAARQAFHQGNLDDAEAKYLSILAHADNPDAFGELGNIYFIRHQFNDANEAYFKAAEGLIAQNRLLQAQYVIGILLNSHPEYAQKAMQAFNAKLQSAR
jgi:hypothetical protein